VRAQRFTDRLLIVLQRSATPCSMVKQVAVQHVAIQYATAQRSATHSNVVQLNATPHTTHHIATPHTMLHRNNPRWNAARLVATQHRLMIGAVLSMLAMRCACTCVRAGVHAIVCVCVCVCVCLCAVCVMS
jgi:hypothetical protein